MKRVKKTMARMTEEAVGHYAFVAGVLLAIILGLFSFNTKYKVLISLVLVTAGLLVGIINITAKETVPFLVASIALMTSAGFASGMLQSIPDIGQVLNAVFVYIMLFVSPAALVVALKTVYSLAKKR